MNSIRNDVINGIKVNRKERAKAAANSPVLKLFKEYTPVYLMLSPNLVLFLAFVLYPLLWALRYMFYDFDGVTQATFIGVENFIRVFTRDPMWWMSVVNTFIFAFGKLVVEIPLAIILAVILNSNIRGKNLLRGIYFLPNVTSAAVMSLIFSFIFSPYNGILNGYLKELGLINASINWLGTRELAMVSCMIVSIWQNFGVNMLLVLAGLQGIPAEVYESAYIDGAKKVHSFRYITIPMLAPMLQVIIMLAVIGSLQTFDTIYVLTGGGPDHQTDVMAITIFNQFFKPETGAQYGYGAALGFLSSLVIGIITVIYLYTTKKMKNIFE